MRPLPKCTLTFAFDGGPYDGQAAVDATTKNTLLALAWSNTRCGEVGRRFELPSEGSLAQLQSKTDSGIEFRSVEAGVEYMPLHVYEVVTKEVQGDDVVVRCKYLGTA